MTRSTYEKCPICEKKGWYWLNGRFWRGYRCRYCESHKGAEHWDFTKKCWYPVSFGIKRGIKAPKETP